MRELDGRHLPSRIKGRLNLERRVNRLLIALARFLEHRATNPDDYRWAGRAFAALQSLRIPAPGGPGTGAQDASKRRD